MRRRDLLARSVVFGTAAALGACGFHPLYAPSGATNAQLSEVFVDVILNRNGQLLRQALQERLDIDGEGEKRYELSVAYSVSGEAVGIQADNSSTRNRYFGVANWVLKKPGILGAKVTSGSARSLDGVNNLASQFLYGDFAGDAVNRRMAENLSNQIVQSLAAYFRAHGKPT